jgi:membrane protein DedA with SNARE-associated domain
VFPDLAGPALDLLAQYGMVVLFVLLVLDNAGIPFPTELVLIVAVSLFATDLMSLVFLIAVATGAALVGSFLLYGVCYAGGRKLVEKRPKLFMMNPRRLERLERVFSKKVGMSLVFFLRLFPLTRVLVSIPAGIARMRPAAFLVLTFVGMAIYHVVLVVLAYRFGVSLDGGASLDAARASPAWQYVQTNHVVTVLGLLGLGLFLSLRASRSTLKDPEWSSPSRIGWLAERVAVFGGLALLVLVFVDVQLVHRLLGMGGLELAVVANQLGWEASSLLVAIAGLSLLVGFPAMFYSRKARRRKWEAWEHQHGLKGTAQVFAKPRSASAAGQDLRAHRGIVHDETIGSKRSEPKPGSEVDKGPKWDP